MVTREPPILFASSSVLTPLIKVSYDLHFSRSCCWLYFQFLRTAAIVSHPCSSYSCLSLSSYLQGSHYFHCIVLFTKSDVVRVDGEACSLCLNLSLDYLSSRATSRRKMKCLPY